MLFYCAPMRPAAARLSIAALAMTLAGSLSACSGGDDGAEDAAVALAEALTAGDVSRVAVASTTRPPQADLERIVEGLGDDSPRVSVADVTTEDDTATATLATTRTIDGVPWEYETKASLTKVEEQWRVAWEPSIVADVSGDQRLTVDTDPATRGDVLGADDVPLVMDRAVTRFGIDKTQAEGEIAGTSAEALAQLLDIDPDTYRDRVEAAGEQAFVEALVMRADDAQGIEDGLAAIPGARGLDGELPLAPTRSFAQPLLGSVGEATAEIVEDSGGAVGAGDQVGLSGLQQRYDKSLRGTSGVQVRAVTDDDASGDVTVFERAAEDGTSLRTTLDLDLQRAADDILSDVEPASAIVAIRPSTGAIVAMASGPGGEGADTAASGRYAPGSTFKVVTALALLRSGMTPETEVPCTDTVTVDGRSFKNYSDYPSNALGDISLRSAIANSCNTAMIASRDDAPAAELAASAGALGLGRDLDLGIPAFLGSVPTDVDGTERAASMIGQGRIEASPLAMAVVAASVGSGDLVTPVLLPDLEADEAPAPDQAVTTAEGADLGGLMRAVVTDGSGGFLADVPGGPVGAKTGTAEFGDDVPPRTHAWMIATQDDLAVAVFVADGDSGSATAGPLLERFLRAAQ